MAKIFRRLADRISLLLGSPATFAITCLILTAWLVDYWQSRWAETVNLAGNVAISVFTLLALIILQHSQNRNDRAIHLKLDELIGAVAEARNEFMGAEQRADQELDELGEKIKEVTA